MDLTDEQREILGLPIPEPPRREDGRGRPWRDPRAVLDGRFVSQKPERLIGEGAYGSDPLDDELAKMGIEVIAPRRNNRKMPKTQDGRKLRRYKRRWKIERLFAWLHDFQRLVIRYERRVENYLGFVHLRRIVILLRYL